MKLFQKHLLLFFLLFTSCNTCFFVPEPPCPAPPSAKPPVTLTFSCENPTVEPCIPDPQKCLNLADLIDIALQNSPETRLAWFNAKAAAADLGTARGAYLPSIQFQYQIERTQTIGFDFSVSDPTAAGKLFQTTYGPTLSTNYLLLDFGGRTAEVCSAVHALEALNWTYNWQVQTVMLNVIQKYYDYTNAKAIVEINKMNVEDYEKTVEVAENLKTGGVKNLADELQARTTLVQAKINLEKDRGAFYVAQVNLAKVIGIPLDSCFCVEDVPEDINCENVAMSMEAILNAVKKNRSDLEAQRATVLQNRANIHVARSAFWPTLSTELTGQQLALSSEGLGTSGTIYGSQFSAALSLNWNIFNSYKDVNAIRKAEALWQASQAELDQQELDAFEVALTDFYEFSANSIILKFSHSYLEVAKKNREVAFASYTAGVNTILDVLLANNLLNTARQQLANAKTNWLTSIANLTYDTGGLVMGGICDSNATVCLPDYPEPTCENKEIEETPCEEN